MLRAPLFRRPDMSNTPPKKTITTCNQNSKGDTMTSTDLEQRQQGNISIGHGDLSDEGFSLIARQANELAKSGIVPKAYRGRPHDIVAAAMTGRDLGLPLMASLRMLHVIEGKVGMSAELMSSLIRARGHSLTIDECTTEIVTMTGTREDTGNTFTFSFSTEDMKTANLAGKGVWKSYFRSMAIARCTTQIGRTLFADVIMGVSYNPEELADMSGREVKTDAAGEVEHVIDLEATPVKVVARKPAPTASDVTPAKVVTPPPPTPAPVKPVQAAPEPIKKAAPVLDADLLTAQQRNDLIHSVQTELNDAGRAALKEFTVASGISWLPEELTMFNARVIGNQIAKLATGESVTGAPAPSESGSNARVITPAN